MKKFNILVAIVLVFAIIAVPALADESMCRSVKDYAPVRDDCYATGKVIAYVAEGEVLNIVDRKVNSKGNLWYQVFYADRYGWIYSDNVTTNCVYNDRSIPLTNSYLSPNDINIRLMDYDKTEAWFDVEIDASEWYGFDCVKLFLTSDDGTVISLRDDNPSPYACYRESTFHAEKLQSKTTYSLMIAFGYGDNTVYSGDICSFTTP